MEVTTNKGRVRIPAYLPVTTYGKSDPLDSIIRPFLPRFTDMMMVSYPYAAGLDAEQKLPFFIDSGSFTALFDGSEIIEREDGLATIRRTTEDGVEDIAPEAVLALQEQYAEWGATLDFPIPPSIEDTDEREKRLRLTLANAKWAIGAKTKSTLRIFGVVQGWDEPSYLRCASELLSMGYRDLALGGFVPRTDQRAMLVSIVQNVRAMLPQESLLHVFGMGEATLVKAFYQSGATSVDSYSFVRAAVSGKRWDGVWRVECPSTLERAHSALANLRFASQEAGAGHAPAMTAPEKALPVVADF
jgi:helicase